MCIHVACSPAIIFPLKLNKQAKNSVYCKRFLCEWNTMYHFCSHLISIIIITLSTKREAHITAYKRRWSQAFISMLLQFYTFVNGAVRNSFPWFHKMYGLSIKTNEMAKGLSLSWFVICILTVKTLFRDIFLYRTFNILFTNSLSPWEFSSTHKKRLYEVPNENNSNTNYV